MRSHWVAAALVLAAVLALGLQTEVITRTGFFMGDFRAFYCGARVAAHGSNPYHAEPLRTCEIGIGENLFFEKNPGVTIPAPLPGYVLGALVPLALLPFGVAAAVWGLLMLLASLACIVTLGRFAGIGWQIALAIFALSLCAISLPFGEVVPLALAAICACAYFGRQRRWHAAGLCAAGAMIEPHLGLPVCVALALWAPASRAVLAAAAVVLAALSLALLGPATNLEYFTAVLPAHALSEVTRDTQFSLTAVLASLGASQTVAVRGGSLWYVAMLIVGTLVAGLLARKSANGAFLACVPPAFAVLGGTFIHVTQIAAALPAAAIVVFEKKEHQPLALVALLALAVPWLWVVSPALIVAPLVPVGYLAWRYWNGNVQAALLAAVAAAVLVWGLMELAALPAHTATHAHAVALDPRLAEATWSAFTQKSSTNSVAAWMLRIPTWAGLVLLLAILIRDARRGSAANAP